MVMRGLLPRFIENFLEERKLRVKMINVESATRKWHPPGQRVERNAVNIKMDEVSTLIPHETAFLASLHIDDLQISYAHSDMRKIREKLQEVVDRTSKWGMGNGFCFLVSKTKGVHFKRTERLLQPSVPEMYGRIIPYEKEI